MMKMKLLAFACVLLAVDAVPFQGYSFSEPPSGDVLFASPPRSDNPVQSGQTQSIGTSQQSSVSTSESFSAQSDQSSSQFSSDFSQQLASGEPAPSVGFVQSSFGFGDAAQVEESPVEASGTPENLLIDSSKSSENAEENCPHGQVRHLDGSCVTPEITRNVFVYDAPEMKPRVMSPPKDIPLPKLEHNIIFIHAQDGGDAQEPIIVPPPQRKHVIYVLNKDSGDQGQRVIEVTTQPPKTPEVYFVNYAEGQTPTLPDGLDFETALNSAVHSEGRIISASENLGTLDVDNIAVNSDEDVTFVVDNIPDVSTVVGSNTNGNGDLESNNIIDVRGSPSATSGYNGFNSNSAGAASASGFSTNNSFNSNSAGATSASGVSTNNGFNSYSASASSGSGVSTNNGFNTNSAGANSASGVSTNNGYNTAGGSGFSGFPTEVNSATSNSQFASSPSGTATPQRLYNSP